MGRTRVFALLLTLATGFTGLVYEVTWQKYLGVLLGSHSEATAAVLAIFLGGLSLGYGVFGRVTRRAVEEAARRGQPPRLLLLYGLVEAGIGLYVLFFPLLFGLAQAVSFRLPIASEGPAFGFDVLLAAILIGPPTVLMGGTIPILTQALARDLDDATRVHAAVYAVNTAGAFVGALAAGFFLIERLGLDGVLYAMGFVNLGAGAVFALLERSAAARAAPSPVPEAPNALPAAFASYAGVALLAGFAMMTVQTVLIRVGGLAFGASHFTFAMVVACFVLCIALGSFAVSALARIPRGLLVGTQWALVGLGVLLYLELENAPYWAHVLRSLFRDEPSAFYPYYANAFAAILLVLAVPIGLSGALLPLLFDHLRREVVDLGGVAGRLYSWNTVGSLLGALLGGYALLFWLDLHQVFRIALAALVVGSAILTARVLRVSLAVTGLLAVVPALVGLAALPAWSPERLSAGLFRRRAPTPHTYRGADAQFAQTDRVIFYRDDPSTSVAVKEIPIGPGRTTRALFTDGKPDGALVGDYVTMSLAGVLAALFADELEHAFVIGYGTGVTAGELALLEGVRSVEVAEISAGVLAAAPLFDGGNQGASRNPRIRTIRSDAYRALLRSAGRYDVIVSEPSNPWRTGVEMLFSREFLEAARARLAPGGVYAQWLHTYETDAQTVTLILRTYAAVFDHVAAWYTIGPDILLLGFERPDHALDLDRLARRIERPDFRAALARIWIGSLPALLAHELLPLGVPNALAGSGPVHTLRHPLLSHRAARAFFRGEQARFPKLLDVPGVAPMASNALLLRHARAVQRDEVVLEQAARETCDRLRPAECAALLARWRHGRPDSPRREELLARLRAVPLLAEHVGESVLAELASLYDPRAGTFPSNGDPVARAERATERYLDYYHYAVPFEARALDAMWRGCTQARHAQRCRQGRERAARQVHALNGAAPGG